MAHPLTQHPPSTLPFHSAPRPSPLAFGFGHASSPIPLSFGTPPRSPAAGFGGHSSLGFGFGFAAPNPSASTSTSTSPSKRPISRHTSSPSTTRVTASLKRPRRSPSPTPSSSPSPSSSVGASPHLSAVGLPKGKEKDDLSVGGLALKDEAERRIMGRKDVKRSRREPTAIKPTMTSDIDVGVLLAALPPSAHLPILLNVLSSHPSFHAEILARLPHPEPNECLSQLEKHLDRIKRAAGLARSGLNLDRAWSRASKDVDAYCRMATTYLNFFTSPSTHRDTPPEPQALQTLLHTLSSHLYYLLCLIPPSAQTSNGTPRTLLDLGQLVVASWTKWVENLSQEVNQRAGMYPHGTVNAWVTGLDALASNDQHPTSWPSTNASQNQASHHLVDSFRSAMIPIRDRFLSEVGWLVGRISGQSFSYIPAPRPPTFDSFGSGGSYLWNHRPPLISAGTSHGGEDEEL